MHEPMGAYTCHVYIAYKYSLICLFLYDDRKTRKLVQLYRHDNCSVSLFGLLHIIHWEHAYPVIETFIFRMHKETTEFMSFMRTPMLRFQYSVK